MSDVIDVPADLANVALTQHFDEPAAAPIEIDPRPCEHCGLLLDDHFTIDGPEGPEHFCHPLDVALQLRALRLQEAWERADPRDRWKHTGARPPKAADVLKLRTEPYRPAQSTIDAFWYVVRLADQARLAAWLDDHPEDESFLLNLLESKK